MERSFLPAFSHYAGHGQSKNNNMVSTSLAAFRTTVVVEAFPMGIVQRPDHDDERDQTSVHKLPEDGIVVIENSGILCSMKRNTTAFGLCV